MTVVEMWILRSTSTSIKRLGYHLASIFLYQDNMTTHYSWKCDMACNNITNVVFLNTWKASLNWSLDAVAANYIWMYLQNASSMCKWNIMEPSIHKPQTYRGHVFTWPPLTLCSVRGYFGHNRLMWFYCSQVQALTCWHHAGFLY